MTRKLVCECGDCRKCKQRVYQRTRYHAMTLEERRQTFWNYRNPAKVTATWMQRYYRNHEEILAQRALRRSLVPRDLSAAEAWAQRNPEKKRTHLLLQTAVRSGKLTRGHCEVCGSSETDGHHADYTKPLDVQWLCRLHHKELHRTSAHV